MHISCHPTAVRYASRNSSNRKVYTRKKKHYGDTLRLLNKERNERKQGESFISFRNSSEMPTRNHSVSHSFFESETAVTVTPRGAARSKENWVRQFKFINDGEPTRWTSSAGSELRRGERAQLFNIFVFLSCRWPLRSLMCAFVPCPLVWIVIPSAFNHLMFVFHLTGFEDVEFSFGFLVQFLQLFNREVPEMPKRKRRP